MEHEENVSTYANSLKTKKLTFLSVINNSVFVTQSSVPIHLVIMLLRSRLQNLIHLLGVTPFVLF